MTPILALLINSLTMLIFKEKLTLRAWAVFAVLFGLGTWAGVSLCIRLWRYAFSPI